LSLSVLPSCNNPKGLATSSLCRFRCRLCILHRSERGGGGPFGEATDDSSSCRRSSARDQATYSMACSGNLFTKFPLNRPERLPLGLSLF
jgi:hypothetical protein